MSNYKFINTSHTSARQDNGGYIRIGAYFNHANLSDASFQGVDFAGVELWGANLRSADLKDSNLTTVKTIAPDQVKVALNWEKATYTKEFCEELRLKGCRTGNRKLLPGPSAREF